MSKLLLFMLIACCAVPASGIETPQGLLGHRLGTYLTIEGVRVPPVPRGFYTLTWFRVYAVNGKKLEKPIDIDASNTKFEADTEYVLHGYETGQMVGFPEEVAEHEPEHPRRNLDQTFWHFGTWFVVTSVVEPEGIHLEENPHPFEFIIHAPPKATDQAPEAPPSKTNVSQSGRKRP
jgi:hypothetical protein